MNKWEWDRKSIREYRKKHEPYNSYEKMMMDMFEGNPFLIDIRKRNWHKRTECGFCKEGTRYGEEDKVLPSGITIMVRRCSNSNCGFFEKIVLDGEGKVLDYEHEPEIKTGGKMRKLTKEEMKQAKEFLRNPSWSKRRKKRG